MVISTPPAMRRMRDRRLETFASTNRTNRTCQQKLHVQTCSLDARRISKCCLFPVWFLKTLETSHYHWKRWLCERMQNFEHRFSSQARSRKGNPDLSEFLRRNRLFWEVCLPLNSTTCISNKEIKSKWKQMPRSFAWQSRWTGYWILPKRRSENTSEMK